MPRKYSSMQRVFIYQMSTWRNENGHREAGREVLGAVCPIAGRISIQALPRCAPQGSKVQPLGLPGAPSRRRHTGLPSYAGSAEATGINPPSHCGDGQRTPRLPRTRKAVGSSHQRAGGDIAGHGSRVGGPWRISRESREGALGLEAPGGKDSRGRVVQRCRGPRGSQRDALGGSGPGMGLGWRPPSGRARPDAHPNSPRRKEWEALSRFSASAISWTASRSFPALSILPSAAATASSAGWVRLPRLRSLLARRRAQAW